MQYPVTLNDIWVGVEQVKDLLCLINDFILDIPESSDKEKGWKLDLFCERKDMLGAVVRSARDQTFDLLSAIDTLNKTKN